MLKQKILDSVNTSNQERFSSAIGTITTVYASKNTADVRVSTKSSNKLILEDMPLPVYGNGIKLASPNAGDKVLISFADGNFLQGKIVSLIDDKYQYNTRNDLVHINSGNYVSYIDFDNLEVKEMKKSLSECVIDEYNTNSFKYFEFTKNEPLSDFTSDVSTFANFKEDEVGIINKNKKSIVKIKSDGSIDIFTRKNIGININPITGTISFIGDAISTNSDKVIVNAKDVDFRCDDFSISANKITLESEELNIQKDKETYSINEVIGRI